MSVPKYKRNVSGIEFINNFNRLRKEIIMLLMRDFGLKARNYSVHLLENIYGIEEDDKAELEAICEKYGVSSAIVDKYPDWLINGWRNEIMAIINEIGIEIYSANSIFVNNIHEYYTRRMHWNQTIGYCMALKDKLQEIISCVKNVKLGSYEVIFGLIDLEIKLIKGVRKSDNKVLKGLNYQLPYFNDGYVYNNYAAQPFVPNYYMNNSSVTNVQTKREMCRLVSAPTIENIPTVKVMCRIVEKPAA